MNWPFFIASRISLSDSGRGQSPAVKVAITAVALSVTVMLASVAIVLGFQREIRDKVIGFNSQITVTAVTGQEGDSNLVSLTPDLAEAIDSLPFVSEWSLEASMPAILKTKDNFKGVYLHSMQGNRIRDFIRKNLAQGKMPDGEEDIAISALAARQLNLKPGDKIDTYFITDNVKARRLLITGIYDTHFDQYDDLMVYGDMSLVREIAGLSRVEATAIDITVDDFDRVQEYTQRIDETLIQAYAAGDTDRPYHAGNVLSSGAVYFQWLALLDTNVAVIIILMTFVAIVTLISGMLILILDKKSMIGLLRALGARRRRVSAIFIWLALKIALIGMAIGNCLTLGLLWAQDKWHLVPLDPDAYYIDFVPVELNWLSVVMLNLGVLTVIWLSLILPAYLASHIAPATTLKAE